MADIQFNLRIPEELKDKIKLAANENGRSINAEAQFRLEQSFEISKSNNSLDTQAITDLLVKNMLKFMDELRSEGVESEKLAQAILNINKK